MIKQTINNKTTQPPLFQHVTFALSAFLCSSPGLFFFFLIASNTSDMIPLTYSSKTFSAFNQSYMKYRHFIYLIFCNLSSLYKKDRDCIYENVCS